MTARRFLTFLVAILITALQTLILVTDTAASAEVVLASAASLTQSLSGASNT